MEDEIFTLAAVASKCLSVRMASYQLPTSTDLTRSDVRESAYRINIPSDVSR